MRAQVRGLVVTLLLLLCPCRLLAASSAQAPASGGWGALYTAAPAVTGITASTTPEEEEVDASLLPPSVEVAALDAVTQGELPVLQEKKIELDPRKLFPITAGLRVGSEFPQVLSSLGIAPVVTLEVGYLLPMLGQRLQLFLDGSYTKGKRSVSPGDARLPGNTVRNYGTREREIVLSFGGRYRLFDPSTPFNVYGRMGLSLSVRKSRDAKERERAIGTYRENIAIPGMVVAGGIEYMLGPGAISAEVSYATEMHDLRFRGGLEEGGIGFTVGYHFMF